MKTRQWISLLCAAALALSLAACSSTSTEDYAGQTLTGQVTAIDGSSVTLQLGELEEQQADANAPTPPQDSQAPADLPEAPQDGSAPAAPDQTPPESGSGSDLSAPPAKPDSDSSNSSAGSQTPPDAPSGQPGSGETPPDLPAGGSSFTAGEERVTLDFSAAALTENGEQVDLSALSEGDVVTVAVGSGSAVSSGEIVSLGGPGGMGGPGNMGAPDGTNGPGNMGGPGGGFGGSSTVTQGSSANTISEDGVYSNETYTSTGDDENALRIDGAAVTLEGITVDKSAGATSNTENGDFYGVNAALLATNGATVTITNATVTSSAQNGNGVFSYGSGTTVNISDSTITTTADNSGGIQTTGGGTTNAENLTVETSGNSSAAIRSDRGGGTVKVTGGVYTSGGYNSPAVYSTADITVKNAVLTANRSEALVIEGKNSIVLENCTVSGNMSDTQGASSDENVHNVMIYQSMSGDADVGTSVFSMTGGSLTAKNGDMFYITNTHCILTLSGVTLRNEDADGALLRVVGNSASHGWGSAGSNGAQAEFTANAQTLEGDIIVDSISTLELTLTGGSSLTGTVSIVENAQGGAAVDSNAAVTIDSGCTWTLTGDCVISSLVNSGTINFNGYTITLADGTVLR